LDTKYATGSPSCVLWDDNWRTWYADSAYRFVEHEEKLAADNMPGQICEKDTLGHPLTDAQKETNWVKSNVRALVEHVFSAQAQKWGAYRAHHRLRRTQVKIGMMNLVCSMRRLVQLIVRDMKTSFRAACVTNVVGTPTMA